MIHFPIFLETVIVKVRFVKHQATEIEYRLIGIEYSSTKTLY